MLVPWKALSGTHRHTSQCNWGAEQKRRKLAADEEREVTASDFSAYGRPLEMVTYFRYLRRVILAADDDWPAVVMSLYWEREVWRRMTSILIQEGAAPRVSGLFFKAVVQAVLIFGSENWLVTPLMGKYQGGVQT